MAHARLEDLMEHLANGSLEGAPVPIVDVSVITSDARVISGYASLVGIGQEPKLVLTTQGNPPGMNEDHDVALDDAVWAYTLGADGSLQTFGADPEELKTLLSASFDEARATDPIAAAQYSSALGVLMQGQRELGAADRAYRQALRFLIAPGVDTPWRTSADIWMRLSAVYLDLNQSGSAKTALEQAKREYSQTLGADHPVIHRVQSALERLEQL